jgi:hypothetical protein
MPITKQFLRTYPTEGIVHNLLMELMLQNNFSKILFCHHRETVKQSK